MLFKGQMLQTRQFNYCGTHCYKSRISHIHQTFYTLVFHTLILFFSASHFVTKVFKEDYVAISCIRNIAITQSLLLLPGRSKVVPTAKYHAMKAHMGQG
jgi:glycerol uptake facilitator-like aquaporin